jgi:transcriptional regulator with XRE-family HTH domain
MPERSVPGVLRQRLAHNLKFARQVRGLTQEQLAEAAGMSRSYISEVEYLNRNATIDVLERLTKALDLDVLDLLAPAKDIEAVLVKDRPRRSPARRR